MLLAFWNAARFVQLVLCDIFFLYDYDSDHIESISKWIYATGGASQFLQSISKEENSIKWQYYLQSEALNVLKALPQNNGNRTGRFTWNMCG